MARMMNDVAEDPERILLILDALERTMDEQRKVLVLSDRRELLTRLRQVIVEEQGWMVGDDGDDNDPDDSHGDVTIRPCRVGFYVGGMKREDLEQSAHCDIILATYPMAQEGLDIPDLNTLLLATPKADIEQSVGRILRRFDSDYPPLVIDIVDTWSVFFGLFMKRLSYYRKKAYPVVVYHNQVKVPDGDDPDDSKRQAQQAQAYRQHDDEFPFDE